MNVRIYYLFFNVIWRDFCCSSHEPGTKKTGQMFRKSCQIKNLISAHEMPTLMTAVTYVRGTAATDPVHWQNHFDRSLGSGFVGFDGELLHLQLRKMKESLPIQSRGTQFPSTWSWSPCRGWNEENSFEIWSRGAFIANLPLSWHRSHGRGTLYSNPGRELFCEWRASAGGWNQDRGKHISSLGSMSSSQSSETSTRIWRRGLKFDQGTVREEVKTRSWRSVNVSRWEAGKCVWRSTRAAVIDSSCLDRDWLQGTTATRKVSSGRHRHNTIMRCIETMMTQGVEMHYASAEEDQDSSMVGRHREACQSDPLYMGFCR